MKKIIIYFSIIAAMLAAPSCNDFLDKSAEDFLSPENYYNTEEDIKNSLGGVYATLGSNYTYGRYLVIDAVTDDLWYWNQNEANIIDRLCSWNYTSGQAQLDYIWRRLYEGIERANVLLENIDKPDMDEDVRNKYIGETRFLRAYYHYVLADYWGDVPLKMVSSEKVSNVNVERTPLKDVLNTVVSEMEDVIANNMLETADKYDHSVRVTMTVAQGILARIYLKMAGEPLNLGDEMYTKALYWAQQVKLSGLHDLNDSYDQVFINHSQNLFDTQFRESMWEADFNGNTTTDPNKNDKYSWIGVTNGIICYDESLGYSYGYQRTRLKLWDLFDETDKRKYRTIAPYKYNTTAGKYGEKQTTFNSIAERCAGKWRRGEETLRPYVKNYNETNFPILRYSDVLLMIAEAENELNGVTSIALDALNEVRDRAGIALYANNDTDPTKIEVTSSDDLRQIIRDERARELAFEGIRKHDLIRWGIFVEEMKAAAAEPFISSNVGNGRTQNADERNRMAAVASKMSEKYILLPIPQKELSLNNKMKQNKYW